MIGLQLPTSLVRSKHFGIKVVRLRFVHRGVRPANSQHEKIRANAGAPAFFEFVTDRLSGPHADRCLMAINSAFTSSGVIGPTSDLSSGLPLDVTVEISGRSPRSWGREYLSWYTCSTCLIAGGRGIDRSVIQEDFGKSLSIRSP